MSSAEVKIYCVVAYALLVKNCYPAALNVGRRDPAINQLAYRI